jgi:hypothetical protein
MSTAGKRFDIYGFGDATLDQAKRVVEAALGIVLARRESSYRGVYFRAGEPNGPGLDLYSNVRDGTWLSQQERGHVVVLSIQDTGDMDELPRRVGAGARPPTLLRSRIVRGPDDDEA